MTAVVLGIGENKLRVVAPSVGGGFGCKLKVALSKSTRIHINLLITINNSIRRTIC
jgi:hypothetical protein